MNPIVPSMKSMFPAMPPAPTIVWRAGFRQRWRRAAGAVSALCALLLAASSLAQTVCLPKTGQTQSSTAGDDGDLQQGVAWPSPRFTDNGNGTVTDNLTGLIWLKDANAAGTMTWTNAVNWCRALADGMAGLSDGSVAGDWRMPNDVELRSLISLAVQAAPTLPAGHPFINVVTTARYWSSTPRPVGLAGRPSASRMGTSFNEGSTADVGATSTLYVWAVRGESCLPRTGAYKVMDGDDGDLQKGVAWPSPRFKDYGNGTVRDNLTGLVWTKNANPFGLQTWTNAVTLCRTLASGMYGLSDGSEAGEWRLPNINERRSLLDFGSTTVAPSLPAGHPFTNVHTAANGIYWTSSRAVVSGALGNPLPVLGVGGQSGTGQSPGNSNAVWPVRDNRLPVATNLYAGVEQGGELTLPIIGGKHAPTDADGDTLTVSAVQNPSANGAAVSTDGTNVTANYSGVPGFTGNDTFTYTVSDGVATVTRTVYVTVAAAGAMAPNIRSISVEDGTATVTAFGMPGYTYKLQFTPSLDPVDWQDVTGAGAQAAAGANGLLILTDTNAEGTRFYRTKYVPTP